jgi:hypothetical protein
MPVNPESEAPTRASRRVARRRKPPVPKPVRQEIHTVQQTVHAVVHASHHPKKAKKVLKRELPKPLPVPKPTKLEKAGKALVKGPKLTSDRTTTASPIQQALGIGPSNPVSDVSEPRPTLKNAATAAMALPIAPEGAVLEKLGPLLAKLGKGGEAATKAAGEAKGAEAGLKAEQAAARDAVAEKIPVSRAAGGAARVVKKTATRAKDAAKVAGKTGKYAATHPSYAAHAIPLAAKGAAAHVAPKIALGATVPAVGTAAYNLINNEVRGTAADPGAVARTTGRVAEGVPTALLGLAADTYTAANTGSTKPLEGFVNQQKDYLKQYDALLGPNSKKTDKVVQEKLGLLPAITGALALHATGKAVRRVKPKDEAAASVDRATAKLVKKTEGKDPKVALAAERKLEDAKLKERRRSKRARRRKESQRTSRTEQNRLAQQHREMKGAGSRRPETLGTRESYPSLLGRLDRTPITRKVSLGHVVRYLGARGLTHNTADLIARLKEDRAAIALEPGRAISKHATQTHEVLTALIDHPEVLSDPGVMAALEHHRSIDLGQSIESHTLDTGKRQTTPNPKHVRSRNLTQARAEKILLPEEVHPHELRGEALPPQKAGRDAEKAIRAQAHSYLRRNRDMQAKADTLRKAGRPELADQITARAEQYATGAEKRLAVVDRFRRAEALDREAAKVEEGFAEGDAASLHAQADVLRKKGLDEAQKRLDEFVATLAQRQEEANLAAPIYFHQTDIAQERGPSGGTVYPSQAGVKRTKFKSGSLEAKGRVDESAETLLASVYVNRAILAKQQLEQSFLKDAPHRPNGKLFVTRSEEAALRRQGKIPRDYNTSVRAAAFSGTIHRNEELLAEYEAARRTAAARKAKGEEPELRMLVSGSQLKEFQDQRMAVDSLVRHARVIAKLQSGLMLGTSLTWAEFQTVASPLAIIANHWNPLAYERSLRSMQAVYRKANPRDRAAFEATFGANVGNLANIGEAHLVPELEKSLSRTQQMALKTPAGAVIKSLWEGIAKGGPLAAGIHAYERHVRTFGALMEIDRRSGLTPSGETRLGAHAVRFIENVARVQKSIYDYHDLLHGHPSHEWPTVLAHNPEALAKVEQGVYDMLGDFGSMTRREMNLSPITLFYSFVRYSLRFLFATLPKNHPLKAAILYNLAAANNLALTKTLGGTPDFLQSFGQIVTHNDQGEPNKSALNLARAVPGGNSIIEAVGSGKLDISAIFKPLSPAITVPALALAHLTAFGTPSNLSVGEALGRGAMSLSPLTRPFQYSIGPPQSDLSKLFAAVNGKKPGIAGSESPQFITQLNPDSIKAQNAANTIFDDSIPHTFAEVEAMPKDEQKQGRQDWLRFQKAGDTLDKLYAKYGVISKAEQRKRQRQYEARRAHAEARYGYTGHGTTSTSTSSGSILGGSSGGSSILGGSSSGTSILGP